MWSLVGRRRSKPYADNTHTNKNNSRLINRVCRQSIRHIPESRSSPTRSAARVRANISDGACVFVCWWVFDICEVKVLKTHNKPWAKRRPQWSLSKAILPALIVCVWIWKSVIPIAISRTFTCSWGVRVEFITLANNRMLHTRAVLSRIFIPAPARADSNPNHVYLLVEL